MAREIDMPVVKLERTNNALEYFYEFVEKITQDKQISARDMAYTLKEMIDFTGLMLQQKDITDCFNETDI